MPGRRLDRLVRDERLVRAEVAVLEPPERPLPIGQDVEELRRVRDAGLGQAVTGVGAARIDRVELRDRHVLHERERRAAGFDQSTFRWNMFSASNGAWSPASSSIEPTTYSGLPAGGSSGRRGPQATAVPDQILRLVSSNRTICVFGSPATSCCRLIA